MVNLMTGLVEFDDQFEVGVVPVGFEFGVNGGFALVVVFLVDRALEVFKAVFAVSETGVGNSTEVVDFGGLVKAAVEGADAALDLVVHKLGEGQIVVARGAFEEFLCFFVVATFEVEQGNIGFSIGTALALGLFEVVFSKGVVLLS